MTPDTFIRVLREEGVKVSEYPGWRTRERDDETGLAFGPVRMILNHHTAGRDSLRAVAETGRPDLPPPLAHIHLAKTGVATMCSAGRANHAGRMAVNAYQSFRDELATHPAPSAASGTLDGNDVAYGIETENLGDNVDVYPREQYDAWVRADAAICRHYGWSAESAGCHKETSVEGKVDPRGPVEGYGARGRFTFTPQQFRSDVAERLRHEPGWNPGEEDDMALTADEIKKIAVQVLTLDGVIDNPNPATAGENPFISLETAVRNIETVARRVEAKAGSATLTDAQVSAIGSTVAASPALAERVAELVADKLAARLAD